jgi:hypothetical protein
VSEKLLKIKQQQQQQNKVRITVEKYKQSFSIAAIQPIMQSTVSFVQLNNYSQKEKNHEYIHTLHVHLTFLVRTY